MSDDEFDGIPDEFEGLEDINWDQLLSAPPPPSSLNSARDEAHEHVDSSFPGVRAPSTDYLYDDDDLDSAFLAELDALEESAQTGSSAVRNDTRILSGSAPGEHRRFFEDTFQVEWYKKLL
ncbi:hypothetical protein H0H81_005542 [Sphagnurus paluster]|uniref:Uncharacterized protein n=1 Tax=Sphagnurus paluster TaxID=117069 RepID=A0A9P7GSC1_9AGAR|nr:hypothetical protein H0H81_005542 [Sphagnurus paluster]